MIRPALRWRAVVGLLGAAALAWLASCASTPVGETVAPPKLIVGDHWRYRITDNLARGALSQLDAEVIGVTGHTAQIRFDLEGPYGRSQWVDEMDGEGGLLAGSLWREPPRPFNPPVRLLAFPLDQDKTWRQVIDTLRRDTGLPDQILIYGRVEGRDATRVPAGEFNAVYVYRVVQLDDAEAWRTRTARRDIVWYAPEVKAPAREAREASYTENDGRDSATVRTESTVWELESFRAGRS